MLATSYCLTDVALIGLPSYSTINESADADDDDEEGGR